MPEVLVATPLRYSAVSRPYEFADGISIRELSPIRWDVSIVKGFISEREREDLANTGIGSARRKNTRTFMATWGMNSTTQRPT
jgi:hypothetical protein